MLGTWFLSFSQFLVLNLGNHRYWLQEALGVETRVFIFFSTVWCLPQVILDVKARVLSFFPLLGADSISMQPYVLKHQFISIFLYHSVLYLLSLLSLFLTLEPTAVSFTCVLPCSWNLADLRWLFECDHTYQKKSEFFEQSFPQTEYIVLSLVFRDVALDRV